ncbi:hypothetical protein N7452_006407 [Penicillium brevicompactum]|uniref:Uncharacterized protein n=1 Tax=Penicillium brevicompactum TaxID=5074 RepID=A0A9W9UGM5_PENBR|nr:hypothetical protein N7452_006407 [Penicillium brevicompactum]
MYRAQAPQKAQHPTTEQTKENITKEGCWPNDRTYGLEWRTMRRNSDGRLTQCILPGENLQWLVDLA